MADLVLDGVLFLADARLMDVFESHRVQPVLDLPHAVDVWRWNVILGVSGQS